MRTIHSTVLTLTLACLAPACSEDTARAAGETYELFVRDLREAAEAGHAELTEFTEAALVEIDARIAAVKAEIGRLELDESWDATLADLEARRAQLAQKLDQLRAAGGAGWEELREGAIKSAEEARRAYDAAEVPPAPR